MRVDCEEGEMLRGLARLWEAKARQRMTASQSSVVEKRDETMTRFFFLVLCGWKKDKRERERKVRGK